ncbi:MAG: family 16 glycoside hydrolase, partial [Cyclobacteriaceae bacterium]
LHSIGEDGGSEGIWMHSIECQIIEGGTGDFIVVGDGTDKFSITCPVADEKQQDSYVFQQEGQLASIHGDRINWYGRDPNWKDVIGFRGTQDVEKPMSEWNTLECIAKGDEIAIYLNGTLVNRAFKVKPSKGRIQIQSEGAEIFFRKVVLEPLSKTKN